MRKRVSEKREGEICTESDINNLISWEGIEKSKEK